MGDIVRRDQRVVNYARAANQLMGLARMGFNQYQRHARAPARGAARGRGRAQSKKQPAKKKQKTQKERVDELSRLVRSDKSLHTKKYQESGVITCTAKDCEYIEIVGSDLAQLEDAITGLRFFVPTAPNVPDVSSAQNMTQQAKWKIKEFHSKVTFRNNYNVGADVRVYLLTPKGDVLSAQNPIKMIEEGITDQKATASFDRYDPAYYPTEFNMFNKSWKVQKSWKSRMEPGQELTVVHREMDHTYSPAIGDIKNSYYQARNKSFVWLVRIRGVICHDQQNPTNVSYGKAGVDWVHVRKKVVEYEGGASYNDHQFNNQLPGLVTETNGLSNNLRLNQNPEQWAKS